MKSNVAQIFGVIVAFFCVSLKAIVLEVGVTIPPQREPVVAVMGTNVNVHVLIEGNQNPHFFKPGAKRLAELSDCEIYFTIGFPGEENVEKKFASNGKPVLVSMVGRATAHNHEHENCEATDIHYWTSPIELKKMAQSVYREACRLMPAQEEYFKSNLQAYEKRCDQVLEESRAALLKAGVKHVLSFHPALGNYASAMGISQLAIEKDGRAPTLKVVAAVVTEARKHSIKKLFVQNSGEAEQSKMIVDRLGVAPFVIQLLSPEPLKLIEQITAELVK
jgi:zinc transport system substrate-binding protein